MNREGGKVILAGYHKAKEINTEYNVTGRVAAGAATAVATAKRVDQDYKVRERTAAAARNTYRGAVELNEKHKIGEVNGSTGIGTQERRDRASNSGSHAALH